MKMTVFWAAAVAAMLGVAGCNKAESPAKVDSDVAKAANTAADKDVKASEKEAKLRHRRTPTRHRNRRRRTPRQPTPRRTLP